MRLPPFFSAATDIRFICRDGELIFDAIDGFGTNVSGDAYFTDDVDTTRTISFGQEGSEVRQLIETLRMTDQPQVTGPSTILQVGESGTRIHLNDFRRQADMLLEACPAQQSVVAGTTDLPDLWQQFQGDRAVIGFDESRDWTAVFICDADAAYLELSTDRFLAFQDTYPDPAGQYHAADVPTSINGVQMEGSPCWFGEEGAAETCYVGLPRDRLHGPHEGSQSRALGDHLRLVPAHRRHCARLPKTGDAVKPGARLAAGLCVCLLSACGGVSAAKLHDASWISETSNGLRACFLGFQLDGDLRRNCTTAAGTQWLDGKWALEGDRIKLTFADGEQTCSFSFEETSIVFGPGCVHQGRWYEYEEFKRRTGRN